MARAFEVECTAAEAALDEGNLSHAAHHLAVALCFRTLDPRLQALIQRFATDPQRALQVTSDESTVAGMGALRAFCLARLGRAEEALALVCELATCSDRAYLRWARPWLVPLMETVDPQQAALTFLGVDGASLFGTDTKALVTLLKQAHAAHPEHGLLFLALFRCVRDRVSLAEAEVLARARLVEHKDAFTQLALASVNLRQGDLESSLKHYLTATAEGMEDEFALWLDVGDVLMDLGREDEALEAYEKALDGAPADPWALPSALYLRAKTLGEADARSALLEYIADEPTNTRARTLAASLAPYEAALPPRSEACLVLAEASGATAVMHIASTSFEAPSALVVCRLLLGRRLLSVEFGEVPAPDPRMPVRHVPSALWRFPRTGLGGLFGERVVEGRPGLREPEPADAARVATIAAGHFNPDAWWRDALTAARALGSNARAVALATMVNVPPNPSPANRLADWFFSVQVAAALVIARSDARWAESQRRTTLRDIIAGPVDWVVTAALYAVAEVGLREPETREDCVELLREARRIRPISPVVWTCLAEPALELLLRFPDLPDAERAELEAEREGVAAVLDQGVTSQAW